MMLSNNVPPHVRFEIRPVEDRNATIEQGRMIYKDVDYAIITSQGGKDSAEKIATEWLAEIKRKSMIGQYDPNWADRFQKMYDMYKSDQEMPVDGTPLKLCPAFTPSEIRQCESLHIRTLEEAAAMNEQAMQSGGMGMRSIKQRAQSMLENSDKQQAAAKITAQNVEIDELKRQMKELRELIAMYEDEKPKRGRKEVA